MTTAFVATYGTFESWQRADGVSDVAVHLQESFRKLFRSTDDVLTLSDRESTFERRLRFVLDELTVDDGQCAVSAASVRRAFQLVQSLPNGIPVPDVAIDPDGEVELDWMPSRTRMFSISLGDSDRLAYAWLDGSDHAHGVFRFINAIPQPLLLQLAELTVDARAYVRVA